MNNDWKVEFLMKEFDNFAKNNQIDAIITFDDYGVSGHINHIKVSKMT